MLYDLFICHASEDKTTLVRPLAKALKNENVIVWYDEFELKPGDSLRESIDRGLSKSRFGVVVLSHHFFNKKWANRELSGMVARQMNGDTQIIIPIWHNITIDDVLKYSSPLADIFSINSNIGIKKLVRKLIQTIRPQESPLVVARDELIYWGLNPPVISDEWWLDVIEASNRISNGGAHVPESSTWGRWTFPLPNAGSTGEARGVRLAWTALQLKWEEEAENQKITQITHPDIVHSFINQTPGLKEACQEFPSWLAIYAPQITIPGFSGSFESIFSEMEKKPRYGEEMMFRRDITNIEPASAACNFVQGELFSPQCKYYETFDYLIWILSSESKWLPVTHRKLLMEGMADWAVWASGLDKRLRNDTFFEWLINLKLTNSNIIIPLFAKEYLLSAISASLKIIGANDRVDDVFKTFLSQKVLNAFANRNQRVERKRKKLQGIE